MAGIASLISFRSPVEGCGPRRGLTQSAWAGPSVASWPSYSRGYRPRRSGPILGRVHPTAFRFLDVNGNPLPEGQLTPRTHEGALTLSLPGGTLPDSFRLARSWGSATLRVSEGSVSTVKVSLEKPLISAVTVLPGKTNVTINYSTAAVHVCVRLAPGKPLTC